MGNVQSNRNFKAHRCGAAEVVVQTPVDQIWRRGIAVATTAAAECECPALPAPSNTDTNLLAYVCHVSIVMHGGGAGWDGRVGVGRRVGQSVRRSIIMPNSGLYPIRALHHTLGQFTAHEKVVVSGYEFKIVSGMVYVTRGASL